MNLEFYKYQGTGNDFVLVDNRTLFFPKENHNLIAKLCDRKFGIGADGLMLLENAEGYDFRMVYYNSDGKERQYVWKWRKSNFKICLMTLGIVTKKEAEFIAVDGKHEFLYKNNLIGLKMIDVEKINAYQNDFVLNTGSPHYIKIVPNVEMDNFVEDAKSIRYNDDFKKDGINVNYISIDDEVKIRTYERGVEDETLSCGTGNVAAALCVAQIKSIDAGSINLITKGGNLNVYFTKQDNQYTDIWLKVLLNLYLKAK